MRPTLQWSRELIIAPSQGDRHSPATDTGDSRAFVFSQLLQQSSLFCVWCQGPRLWEDEHRLLVVHVFADPVVEVSRALVV